MTPITEADTCRKYVLPKLYAAGWDDDRISEQKTGLLRCYVSRVEHGHTVPSVETLEKMARALEIPMYKLFYESEVPPKLPNLLKRKSAEDILWGSSGKDANMLAKFCRLFGRMEEGDRTVLFFMAQKMARRKALQGDVG